MFADGCESPARGIEQFGARDVDATTRDQDHAVRQPGRGVGCPAPAIVPVRLHSPCRRIIDLRRIPEVRGSAGDKNAAVLQEAGPMVRAGIVYAGCLRKRPRGRIETVGRGGQAAAHDQDLPSRRVVSLCGPPWKTALIGKPDESIVFRIIELRRVQGRSFRAPRRLRRSGSCRYRGKWPYGTVGVCSSGLSLKPSMPNGADVAGIPTQGVVARKGIAEAAPSIREVGKGGRSINGLDRCVPG